MYLNINQDLRNKIKSLLTKPFDFEARNSIQNLREEIEYFYDDLDMFARIYDKEKEELKSKMSHICSKLESCKCVLQEDFCCFGLKINEENLLDFHSIQVQIDRLYDYFKLKNEGKSFLDVNDDLYIRFINFFRVNELLALCISGRVKIRIFDKKIIFSPMDSNAKNELYVTWFARCIETCSKMATIQATLKALKDSRGKVNNDILNFIFDKVFSIKFNEMPKESFELNSVRMLITCIKLVLAIVSFVERKKTINVRIFDLVNEFSLEKKSIIFLINLQKEQLVSEQFLIEENGFLRVRFTKFLGCIRAFFIELVKKFDEDAKIEPLIGGKFFEENNIKNTILSSGYKERYIIFDGIMRGDVSIQNELDIDYILYDIYTNMYYFIQIKYSLFGERCYFEGEIKHLQSSIYKGLKQLKSARKLFMQGDLDSCLRNKGIRNATLDNSCFVLLHNIPQLDYRVTKDEIVLYDWNTFRNLLKNAECIVENEPHRLDENIILKNPYKLINSLLLKHEMYSFLKINIDRNKKIVNRFSFAGKEIIVAGLGL